MTYFFSGMILDMCVLLTFYFPHFVPETLNPFTGSDSLRSSYLEISHKLTLLNTVCQVT